MYDVYLDKILLPVAPSKIQMKVKNQNKTVNLINEGEVNILKQAGLEEITLSVIIPQMQYPFARYKDGFQDALFFLNAFKDLKEKQKPFQFKVSRATPGGKLLYDDNISVSLEDYTVTEDAKNGFDVMVDIKLKQHIDYATKIVMLTIRQDKPIVTTQTQRPAGTAPQTKIYTVVKGDTLWSIAKRYYNDGNQYKKIFDANRDKVSSPNLIYAGQALVVP